MRRPGSCCTTSAPRAGFGLAEAQEGRDDVAIDDWSLRQTADGYSASIAAREFAYALEFKVTQPVLLQGERGLSRKGPRPAQASYYYSQPHLAVSGSVTLKGEKTAVSGEAWLDHEWSVNTLPRRRQGWDWIGLNLADGGALMAFRMRDKQGGTLWAGGSLRAAGGRLRVLAGRSPLRAAAPLALATHPGRVSGRAAGAGGRYQLRTRTDDGRPGARLARKHRHHLLGRRGEGDKRRQAARPGLSGIDWLLAAAALMRRA